MFHGTIELQPLKINGWTMKFPVEMVTFLGHWFILREGILVFGWVLKQWHGKHEKQFSIQCLGTRPDGGLHTKFAAHFSFRIVCISFGLICVQDVFGFIGKVQKDFLCILIYIYNYIENIIIVSKFILVNRITKRNKHTHTHRSENIWQSSKTRLSTPIRTAKR